MDMALCTTSAVDHNCSPAVALLRASHHEKRCITFIFASYCKDRIFSTISFAEVDSKRSTRIYSMDKAIQHFFTILHFRKQCPPFSLRRQQTGHRVSMSMPLREILVCNGRLLWANLHRNCFIFGWHVSPQILLHLKDVPVTSMLLDSPFLLIFLHISVVR